MISNNSTEGVGIYVLYTRGNLLFAVNNLYLFKCQTRFQLIIDCD